MQNTPHLTSQQIKREIQEVRYEIAVAASEPDSEELLGPLYDHLVFLYDKQEALCQRFNGEGNAKHTGTPVRN